ncbi:unnamed protein product, partial [Staurois parvus]
MLVFSAAMARHRYESIMCFMHFNDNFNDNTLCCPRGDPEFDQLHKIQPLVNHLNQKSILPSKKICVNESLINFCGRLAFKLFFPSKRARYGVKMYKTCERAISYTYKFRIYEGKDHMESPRCPDHMGSSGKIVWDLVSSFSIWSTTYTWTIFIQACHYLDICTIL